MGTACVAKLTGCTDYTPAVGSEATQCGAATHGGGGACGFVTGTATCVDKACTNTAAQANAAACTGYLNTCVFINSLCVAKAGCASYVVTTTNGAA